MARDPQPSKMDREHLSKIVAKQIADSLPKEFVAACVEESIRECITNFKVDEYAIREIMKTVLTEKTKELLRTKFEKQVESHAEALAIKALAGLR